MPLQRCGPPSLPTRLPIPPTRTIAPCNSQTIGRSAESSDRALECDLPARFPSATKLRLRPQEDGFPPKDSRDDNAEFLGYGLEHVALDWSLRYGHFPTERARELALWKYILWGLSFLSNLCCRLRLDVNPFPAEVAFA